MDRRRLWLIAAVIVAGLWSWTQYRQVATLPTLSPGESVSQSKDDSTPVGEAKPATGTSTAKPQPRYPDFLPAEVHPVLEAIARGGPYDHRQDDGIFQNRERRLPTRARGYYREYTVPTPGSRDRGARRIVTGGDPPVEYYYTDDHYGSFRKFEVAR